MISKTNDKKVLDEQTNTDVPTATTIDLMKEIFFQ